MTDVQRIATPAVPELATATWTNAFRIGNEVVMSGMTAHPATRNVAQPLGAYEQTLEVLRKLLAYVEAAGGNVRNLYKLVIYVTDIADKDEVGRARRDFFQAPYPCSTLVEVKGLVFPELKVEIDAWARLDVDLSRCA
ncbi:MAG: translation initiation inhibitor [Ramlibacter sp.]|nr:translation initiation inhibitor [Ramlibacter sp.]